MQMLGIHEDMAALILPQSLHKTYGQIMYNQHLVPKVFSLPWEDSKFPLCTLLLCGKFSVGFPP